MISTSTPTSRLNNVLITPHTSGRTDPVHAAEHGRGLHLFGKQLLPAYLRGETLLNAVEWARGY
jgi:phosphoglycerate dehydrogenase-like enzyme